MRARRLMTIIERSMTPLSVFRMGAPAFQCAAQRNSRCCNRPGRSWETSRGRGRMPFSAYYAQLLGALILRQRHRIGGQRVEIGNDVGALFLVGNAGEGHGGTGSIGTRLGQPLIKRIEIPLPA